MSKSVLKLTASLAIALSVALPVAAQDEITADTVVATVNGQDITVGNMLLVRQGLPQQYQSLPADQLWDGILNQLIQQEALSQDKDVEETRAIRLGLDNTRRELYASAVIQRVAESAATDEAIQAAYTAQYVNAEAVKEYNASHILVETEELALEIIEEVKGGADFAEVAMVKSTGPSGANGGMLGWFSRGMMVEPFQVAVEGLEDGALSGPVQTQFGWHVIKLNESRAKAAPPLEEVRAELVQTLQRDAVTAYVDGLVDSAEVTRTEAADIDTAILGNMDLLSE